MKKYRKILFIFRRDLRLDDNTALINALKDGECVVPCFIFDPRQIGDQPYRSEAAVRFMMESLIDLENQLKIHQGKMYFFEGLAHEVIDHIIRDEKIDALYVNNDYTPFSRKRDSVLKLLCQSNGIAFYPFHDYLLNPPDAVRSGDGGSYVMYTPYMRKAMTVEVAKPIRNNCNNYYKGSMQIENRQRMDDFKRQGAKSSLYSGGRKEALRILKSIQEYKNYDEERNFPGLEATTKLSAHHKFGTCSIRESYQAIRNKWGIGHTLIRELYWRDFFISIGYQFPHVLGQAFHARYGRIKWDNNPKLFESWCNGNTGFPIVDAGMRELNQTGFMQNRVRMITASFLVKDLHIDWQWGERYFAQKLVDYDPLVNNGNWQWVASTGCDAQPYFRIFNPWLQQQKFDPQASYIKKWIPELRHVAIVDIHQIEKKGLSVDDYPNPIIWHEEEKIKTLKEYKRA